MLVFDGICQGTQERPGPHQVTLRVAEAVPAPGHSAQAPVGTPFSHSQKDTQAKRTLAHPAHPLKTLSDMCMQETIAEGDREPSLLPMASKFQHVVGEAVLNCPGGWRFFPQSWSELGPKGAEVSTGTTLEF